jgi:hypothetical protein
MPVFGLDLELDGLPCDSFFWKKVALWFFGLNMLYALPDCVFWHVFHTSVLQNIYIPKLVENVSCNP